MTPQRKFSGPAELFRLSNLDLADLTDSERAMLAYCERAATEDRVLEGNDDLAEELGYEGGSMTRYVLQGLERKGYVKTESFQKGRRVWVRSLDKWTKTPACTVPHWRTTHDKSRGTPTLPIQTLRQVPTTMEYIHRMMREGMTMVAAQHELLSRGISHREMEQEA